MNKHGKDHNEPDQDLSQESYPMQNPGKPGNTGNHKPSPQLDSVTTDAARDNRRHSPSVVDKFVIRLPQGLRDQIRELSENNRRSMNSEIIMVLEQYIQQHASTASENQVDSDHGEDNAGGRDSDQSGLPAGEKSLDEKLKSLPPEKKAALLSLLT